jgi:hypothetical protein
MRLYLTFNTGVVAGYQGVPKNYFDGLTKAASVGQYYNYYIKNGFATTHGDVVFVPREGFDHKVPVANDRTGAAAPNVSESGNNKTTPFVVTVRFDGSLEFKIDASDAKDAIEKVEKSLHGTTVDGNYSIEGVKKS